jgi:CDP-paratose 2-epimerase
LKTALITGSSGLVGSESTKFMLEKGFRVIGIDNNLRGKIFGDDASVYEVEKSLIKLNSNFQSYDLDITIYDSLIPIFSENSIDLIIHTAGQPSHDWSALNPRIDFEINALGTLNILELMRKYAPDSTMVFTSTNKVYGDRPNLLRNIVELQTRFEVFNDSKNLYSIDENLLVDNCLHSPFGVSKLSADLMCQEFAKYYGMKIGIFRCGCITGRNQMGAELHGFLSYLVKTIKSGGHYRIYGHKGKQVRDNLHAHDLANAFYEFYLDPKPGEVYNMGGGRGNEISILEAISEVNQILDLNWDNYSIEKQSRIGDHIWYVSDVTKFKNSYPNWKIKFDLNKTLHNLCQK